MANLEELTFQRGESSDDSRDPRTVYTRSCPRIIAVEGVDGSGKSSVTSHIAEFLSSRLQHYCEELNCDAFPVASFSAWEANDWTKTLRSILVSGTVGDSRCEALIAFAARRALVLEKIQPFLRSGGFVVLDRYVASSFAYQCYEPNDFKFVTDLTYGSCEGLLPGITFYLDVGAQTAIDRVAKRANVDSIESRGLEFFVELKDKFELAFRLLDSTTDGITFAINANQPQHLVFEAVDTLLGLYLDLMFVRNTDERTTILSALKKWRLFRDL